MTLALKTGDERSIFLVAGNRDARYGSPVDAKSAAQVWRPGEEIGAPAPHPTAGAFFVPAVSCYGGCAWETFGSAEFLLPRSANPRTAATPFASRRTVAAPLQKEHHNE